MMLKMLIISFVFLNLSITLNAQTLSKDSIIKIALADTRNFKLNKEELKQFRKTGKNGNSDLFKPKAATVSNAKLLTDSDYVTAYRIAAYNKTVKRHTLGHSFLTGGLIYIGAIIFATTVLLFVFLDKATK